MIMVKKLKSGFVTLFACLRSVGINPRFFSRVCDYPRFIKDLLCWKKLGGRVHILFPVVGEWRETSGMCKGHYFHQDLLVARRVFENNPQRHIDIGSRVDGFVAHVASFREIEVFDVRDLQITYHRIKFRRADLMSLENDMIECCDSLSCLHALEHFGLGRYGDPIAPDGHKIGFLNIVKLLRTGGLLYLSFPIGHARTEYNAHRVFSPGEILAWHGAESLELIRFDFVDDCGCLHCETEIAEAEKMDLKYGCGIYTFTKIAASQF